MYCEVPRPVGVISTDERFGLETYLQHRLDEYTQLDYDDLRMMLFGKLSVTFPGYKFSINVFKSVNDITKSTFLCENCVYKKDNLGRDVVIGYSKEEAPVPKEEERTALAVPLKEAVEKLKVKEKYYLQCVFIQFYLIKGNKLKDHKHILYSNSLQQTIFLFIFYPVASRR